MSAVHVRRFAGRWHVLVNGKTVATYDEAGEAERASARLVVEQTAKDVRRGEAWCVALLVGVLAACSPAEPPPPSEFTEGLMGEGAMPVQPYLATPYGAAASEPAEELLGVDGLRAEMLAWADVAERHAQCFGRRWTDAEAVETVRGVMESVAEIREQAKTMKGWGSAHPWLVEEERHRIAASRFASKLGLAQCSKPIGDNRSRRSRFRRSRR